MSHTFCLRDNPADLEDSICVEVDGDGEIIRADVFVPALERYVELTDLVKESSYWTQRIDNKFTASFKDDVE